MIVIRPKICFTLNNGIFDKHISCQFNFPYNEILEKCFLYDSISSIGDSRKVKDTIFQIKEIIVGKVNSHLIIGYDQDVVIECYKDK